MTAQLDRVPDVEQPRRGFSLSHNGRWMLGFIIAGLVLFVLHRFVVPNASDGVQQFFKEWLPMTSMNEALVWMICAVGLNIVVGYAGLLDLGFVAFWAIGGYVAGWLMSTFIQAVNPGFYLLSSGIPNQPGIHLNWVLVLVAAGAFCALVGVLIGAPTLRLKSDYLALVTLGFGEIIPQVILNAETFTNGAKGIAPVDQIAVLPFGPSTITIAGQVLPVSKPLGPFDSTTRFLLFALVLAFCVFVSLRIREGRLGRAWLAIREDELAASMMGVPLMRTKLTAYAVGAFMGGLGGVVYAIHVSSVFPDRFTFTISITLLAMVVLGGMGNVWGVMVGALLLAWFNSTFLPQFGDSFNSTFGTDINFPSFNILIFGLALVLMMLFRREGFFPEARMKAVLSEPERSDDEEIGGGLA